MKQMDIMLLEFVRIGVASKLIGTTFQHYSLMSRLYRVDQVGMEPKKTRKKRCLLTSKLSKEILSLLRSLVAAPDPCTISKAQRCHFWIFLPFCFLSCRSATSKSKLAPNGPCGWRGENHRVTRRALTALDNRRR